MARHSTEQNDTVRLDLWLWAARFYKTRSLARHAIETGKVEVEGQRAKPARSLRGGESLRVERAGEIFEATVLALSDTRGPASVAQTLYSESDESRARRAELRLLGIGRCTRRFRRRSGAPWRAKLSLVVATRRR